MEKFDRESFRAYVVPEEMRSVKDGNMSEEDSISEFKDFVRGVSLVLFLFGLIVLFVYEYGPFF